MPSASRSVSSEAESVSRWTRASDALETFLESYCRVSRPERNGRLFELLGVRRFYQLTSAIYHEPMLPTVQTLREGKAADIHPARVKVIYADSGYYEIVNLIYCLAYLPLLIHLYLLRQKWLLAYGLAWLGLHVACVTLERYKRSLATSWLEDYRVKHPSEPPLPEEESVSSAFPAALYRFYFRAAPFESARLYRALGTEWFRLFVVWLKQITTLNPEQTGKKRRIRYLDGITPNAIEKFLEDTRISEVTHVIGTLTLVPFLIILLQERSTSGLIALAPLLWGNVYSVLLQRYHRVRVARFQQRREKRRR